MCHYHLHVQLRSEVEVGAVDSYCVAVQTVSLEQTLFVVAGGARLWYSEVVHRVRAVQLRFVEGVNGADSNCVEEQTVGAVHTRSEVAVGALVS